MEKTKEKEIKIVLTGGHAATTAVAVVQEIKSRGLPWKTFWIGVKNAIEGKSVTTLESEALPKLGVKFLSLTTGRAQRRFTVYTIPSIMKTPIGFIQAFYYLLKVRPRVVLSFGGFASFPVVFCAHLLGIPVIIHEQTTVAGRANKLAIKFASVIALSRRESLTYYPKSKCVITGNPVMQEIVHIKPKTKINAVPTIFITGGSRGSQSINNAILPILRTLLSKYKVIHQTGGLDYINFSDIKQKLPMALKNNYDVFVRVNPPEISEIYKKSDIIVARAGANTVSEIMMIKRPAILIPLPISFLDEQTKNALVAKAWGIAKILPQKELTPEILLKTIDDSVNNYAKTVERIKSKESPDALASKNLLSLVAKYCK